MKDRVVYHIAPNKTLKRWAVVKEGKKAPHAKGLSKEEALEFARRIVRKEAQPALVLIHKTRYIVERQLQLS